MGLVWIAEGLTMVRIEVLPRFDCRLFNTCHQISQILLDFFQTIAKIFQSSLFRFRSQRFRVGYGTENGQEDAHVVPKWPEPLHDFVEWQITTIARPVGLVARIRRCSVTVCVTCTWRNATSYTCLWKYMRNSIRYKMFYKLMSKLMRILLEV